MEFRAMQFTTAKRFLLRRPAVRDPRVARQWSAPVLTDVYKMIELGVLLAIGGCTAVVVRVLWPVLDQGGALLTIAAGVLIAFEVLRLSSAYSWPILSGGHGQWRRTGLAAICAALVGMGCLALQHHSTITVLGWGLTYVLIATITLAALRALASEVLRGWIEARLFATKVAVVGDEAHAVALTDRLLTDEASTMFVVGRYTLEPGTERGGEGRLRGDLRTLLLDCKLNRMDAVVLAPPPNEPEVLAQLRATLDPCAQDLYVLAEASDLAAPGAQLAALGRQPLVLVRPRPLKDWQGTAKAIFDRLGALALLILLGPVLSIVALLVKLESPGPVLFRQLRVGYNNQLFPILKFRSMRNDAADPLATRQTTKDDPRVTRFGRFLRKNSIDELPQLINVLRGEMSLVGPRPHAPGTSADGKRVQELVAGYPSRHLVRPGITGLAQVRGFRGGMHTTTQVVNRLESDLEYIRRQSLWFDVKILLMTVVREVRSTGAF